MTKRGPKPGAKAGKIGPHVTPVVRRLIEIADASGEAQTAICARAGVAVNAISLLRSGERTGQIRTIAYIAEALGYSLALEPLKTLST